MSSSLFDYVFSGKSSSESDEDESNFKSFVPIDVDKIIPSRKKSTINSIEDLIHLDDLSDGFANFSKKKNENYEDCGVDGSTPKKSENYEDCSGDFVNDVGSTSKKKGKEKCYENLNDFYDEGTRTKENFEDMHDLSPCVGQKFDTLDEAERFYRDYGRKMGFEIIIRSTHKYSRSDSISSRLYICRKGGKTSSQSLDFEDEEGKVRRVRDTLGRTNCEARMCVVHRVKLNVWEVSVVQLEHNHAMISPDKIQFMQRSRNIGPLERLLIETLDKSGIRVAQSMNLFSDISGGRRNVGFTSQDIRNVLRDIRHRVFDSGDAEAGLILLRELSASSLGNFFYRVDLDDENRVNSLLWVDPRSLNAYKNFGDVVTFDSTYRTNRYCMPFIPITGVNHHYQSILFGFALVRDEKETSYKWVLKTWLEAVDNKAPISIITDQDKALGNAIAEVLPETNHTYCTWHISNKFPEKLSSLYSKFPDFKKDFNSCVYKSLTGEEFEQKWGNLITKYKLENHSWLNDMYLIRHKWIRAYTRFYFAAGMTTTSRSESMNSFFDEYVKASTGLKEFIENSQKALEKQYLREVEADYETMEKERRFILGSPLERHAATIYTKEMFRRFQREFRRSGSYVIQWYQGPMFVAYKSTVPADNRQYITIVVAEDNTLACVCKTFEHSGMICKHLLQYLNISQVREIPLQFIKLRWTRNGNKVASELPFAPLVLNDFSQSQAARYGALCKAFQGLGASASCSIPRFNYVMGLIEKEKYFIDNFPEDEGDKGKGIPSQCEGHSNPILDPVISQTKGRKKDGRFKSGLETSTCNKTTRKCSLCGKTGVNHDKRNCPRKQS